MSAPADAATIATVIGVTVLVVALVVGAVYVWDRCDRRRRDARETARASTPEARRWQTYVDREWEAFRRVIDRELARMDDEDGAA